MIVVFYDRKNKREVCSYQLVPIKLVQFVMTVDGEGESCASEQLLSNIGYKSVGCPKYQNWDLHCMESDLVFLRLTDEITPE